MMKKNRLGFVYLVQVENKLKIGFTANPEQRFIRLRSNYPADNFMVISCVPGSTDLETQILTEASRAVTGRLKKTNGGKRPEWFSMSNAVVSIFFSESSDDPGLRLRHAREIDGASAIKNKRE